MRVTVPYVLPYVHHFAVDILFINVLLVSDVLDNVGGSEELLSVHVGDLEA